MMGDLILDMEPMVVLVHTIIVFPLWLQKNCENASEVMAYEEWQELSIVYNGSTLDFFYDGVDWLVAIQFRVISLIIMVIC